MRLIPGSRFYGCVNCLQEIYYSFPHPLVPIGLLSAICSQSLWLLARYADDIGYGSPGQGLMELIGLSVGLVGTTGGLAIAAVGIIMTNRLRIS